MGIQFDQDVVEAYINKPCHRLCSIKSRYSRVQQRGKSGKLSSISREFLLRNGFRLKV